MTTAEKLINRKLSLLELAEYLSNVSEACRIQGVSRQNFYDIKKAYEEGGIEGLREKTQSQEPCCSRSGAAGPVPGSGVSYLRTNEGIQ